MNAQVNNPRKINNAPAKNSHLETDIVNTPFFSIILNVFSAKIPKETTPKIIPKTIATPTKLRGI